MDGPADGGGPDWRAIVERAPAGVVVGDGQGRLKYCNAAGRAALARAGVAGGGLLGKPVEQLLRPFPAAFALPGTLAGGDRVWYLTPSPDESLEDARFAAEVSDSLGGTLARRGAVALSATRLYEEESRLTRAIRAALLPPPLPSIEGIRLGAAYRAAQESSEIGGDFYELHPDREGWAFTLGDVCGKGVEAAVLTGQVRQSIRTVSLLDPDPVSRLELLNSALLATDGNSFVTLVHGLMRPVDGGVSIRVAAGGHPPPLLRRRDGTVEEVRARGPIVGMLPEVRFEPAEMVLGPGETLLCYTDGVPDAKGPGGFLGPDRLSAVLAGCGAVSAQGIADRCLEAALGHLDGRPHDDMAVLAIQVDAS